MTRRQMLCSRAIKSTAPAFHIAAHCSPQLLKACLSDRQCLLLQAQRSRHHAWPQVQAHCPRGPGARAGRAVPDVSRQPLHDAPVACLMVVHVAAGGAQQTPRQAASQSARPRRTRRQSWTSRRAQSRPQGRCSTLASRPRPLVPPSHACR